LPFLIFAVALAVRLVSIYQLESSPFFDTLLGDAHGYDLWAQRLAAGDWIGTDVFYQAPLYPYSLGVVYAIFGRDLLIVRIIQAVIGSASCVLLGMAAARMFSKRVGWIAGLGLALWAPSIFFDGLLQKSVLDMFFMCLSLWLIAANIDAPTRGKWLALGAAMAALALSRENALLLIVVVATWIFWRARASALAAFVVGLLIVFTPVVARNYSIDHRVYLTTSQFGSNFYIGNNPNADGTYAAIRFGRGSAEFERNDAKDVAEEAVGHSLSPAEVSSFWFGKAMDFITSEPGKFAKLEGKKALLLINRAEMIDTEAQESYEEISTPLRLLAPLTNFGILVPLAALGMLMMWPERRRLAIVYALTVAYAVSVVIFFVFARYRYPLVAFLLPFAGVPFDAHVRNRIANTFAQGRGRFIIGALTLITVAILANIPLLEPTLMKAITETNLGTALMEQKRYDESIAHHDRAIQLRPDYAAAYNNRGAALRAAGRLDEAVASYRKALELDPAFVSASYNLANAQLELGMASDSAASFRQALKDNPNSFEAHNNLGIALASKGDTAGAIAEFRAALAINERSVHAHRNLGNMLFDMGQQTEGMAHLERAVEIAPNEPEAVYDIGTILLQAQKFAAAAARFETALKIKPDWAEAHNNLGIALASQGRLAEALTHFERAVALNPSLADARANRDRARAALRR
jgi:tetratricopeptide (TPR) repeat protein